MTLSALAVPFLIALAVALLLGGRVIAALASAKARQPISEDAPEAHKIKHGTPTMGGLLILASALAGTAVAALAPALRSATPPSGPGEGWRLAAVAGVFLAACLVGLADDLGIWYYGLGILYLCFFGNAVNFTDGLDGLACGTTLIASLALAATVSVLRPEVGIFYVAALAFAALGVALAPYLVPATAAIGARP